MYKRNIEVERVKEGLPVASQNQPEEILSSLQTEDKLMQIMRSIRSVHSKLIPFGVGSAHAGSIVVHCSLDCAW